MQASERWVWIGLVSVLIGGIGWQGLRSRQQAEALHRAEKALAQLQQRYQIDSLALFSCLQTEAYLRQVLFPYDTGAAKVGSDLASLARSLLDSYTQEALSLRWQITLYAQKAAHLEASQRILRVQQFLGQKREDSLEQVALALRVRLDSLSYALHVTLQELQQVQYNTVQLTSPKGDTILFFGRLREGQPDGFGVGFYEGKGYYIGQWKGNQRHGWGLHVYKDGSSYEGCFEEDKRDGFGVYRYPTGDTYIGEWKDNLMDGKGELILEGKSIKGRWVAGKLKLKE